MSEEEQASTGIYFPPDYNTIEYAPIELLERGDTDIWLRRRGDILKTKSKETALDCEASKIVTLGAVAGAAIMSANPLAWIGLLIAGFGYVYTLFQERQDLGVVHPVPLYRGKLGNIFAFMEGEETERQPSFMDEIAYLSCAEKAEAVLIRGRLSELSRLLKIAPPKARFDLYRYTCDQFYLRQDLITGEEVGQYLTTAVSEARRTMPPQSQAVIEQGEASLIAPQCIETQPTQLPPQPVEVSASARTEVSPTLSKLEPVDVALSMALVPKSTIIAASPRVGKGFVVSMAIAHLRRLHPDLEIWLIDPKDEPTERHYWELIDPDKRCHFDLRDFDVDVETAIEVFSEHLSRFNRSQSHRKLLIIDEFVTLNQKCAGPFMNQLKDFIVGICSSGEVNPDMGIGRFVWAITQSPYVSDIGFKTKAALATFQRIFLLNKASVQLYQLAVSASFVPTGFEQKINRLLEPTGRIFYYSRTDSWHPVPDYSLPNSSNDNLFRAKLEGLLKSDTSGIDTETPKKPSSSGDTSDTGTDTGIDTADTETPETLVSKGDTSDTGALNDTGIENKGDTSDTSRFTPTRLTKEQVLRLINQMKISEMSQTQIIQTLWSVEKNKVGWKQAYNEYKGLTGE